MINFRSNYLVFLYLLLTFFISSTAFAASEDQYDDIIRETVAQYPNVDFALVKALIKQESNFNTKAGSLGCAGGGDPASCTGAYGLMQLMPATAEELGLSAGDRGDPRKNIEAGTKYLAQQLAAHNGNITLALAAYNAGPGNVAKYGGVPPFKETINYVHKVVDNYKAYGGTKPTGIDDAPVPGSGGEGGRPPSEYGGDAKVGNPSILSITDSAQIVSDFESYLGLPNGVIRNIFLGAAVSILLFFAAIQFIWFFGMPISGSLAGANGAKRLVTPVALSIRTMVLTGFLAFFILNSFT